MVNDDVFHFVGISLGPDAGEQIIQDGLEANFSPSGDETVNGFRNAYWWTTMDPTTMSLGHLGQIS